MLSHRNDTDRSGATSFNRRSLRLLVCSGNLGNAAPDSRSLAAWIPLNGLCSEVLVDSPKYPIAEEKLSPRVVTFLPNSGDFPDGQEIIVENDEDESVDDDDDDAEERKFDLIVVGLQESTFDVAAAVAAAAAGNGQNEPENGGLLSALPTKLGEIPSALVELPTALGKAGLTTAHTAAHTAKRGITAVKTLATSKDYVKHKSKNQSSYEMSLADRATSALNELTADGTQILHAMLASHLPSYHHIVSFQRGEMRLEIFALKEKDEPEEVKEGAYNTEKPQDAISCPSWIEVLSVRAQNTGRGGLANKGGILAQLLVAGTTRLSFLTAHLEAHEGQDKYKMRVNTLADILAGTQTDTRFDASLTSHTMFTLGDLNFRTELNLKEDQEFDKEFQMEQAMLWVEQKNWEQLNDYDELQHALRTKDCLVGFQTLPCLFPPTFKVERKPGYSYKRNRRPSYTDRILWKSIPSSVKNSRAPTSQNTTSVRPLIYEPIDEFATSDHKPIRGAFEVHLNERLRLRPALQKWQSKRSRKGSLGNASKEKSGSGCVHVFVHEMKCQVSRSNYNRLGSNSVPDTYLCFMSRPKEMVRADQKKWKTMWKRAFSCTQPPELGPSEDGAHGLSTLGWPRSKKKWETFDPDWGDEEVHFTLQTHNREGLPLELAGSLLFIALLDHGAKLEDHLIGSCVLNLQDIFLKNHPLCQKGKSGPLGQQQHQIHRPHSHGGSRRNLFRPHPRGSLTSEGSVMTSFQIDEPLLKNGKEMGRIRCSIDAWWLDYNTARSILSSQRPSSRGSLFAETLDHPPPISLSSRRQLIPPTAESQRRKKGIRFWRKDD